MISGCSRLFRGCASKTRWKTGVFQGIFFRTSSCGLRSCSAQTWFLILFLCLGYFRPRGRKIDSTKEATIEDADSESLKWFLSGVFNPILLWFNKLHLNHIWGVPSTARRVYTPIKLQTFAEAFWVLIRFRKTWGNIVPEILEGLEYFGRYGSTVCHVSSSAHVQKGLEIESLSSNQTQRDGGYLVSLKRWKSTCVPSTELPIVWRFTKAALPKIEFKAAIPGWVTMYLPCRCQLFNCVSCWLSGGRKPTPVEVQVRNGTDVYADISEGVILQSKVTVVADRPPTYHVPSIPKDEALDGIMRVFLLSLN